MVEVGRPLYGGMAAAWELGMRLCHCMPCHAMALDAREAQPSSASEEGWSHAVHRALVRMG